jgi:hypothetical protein
MKATRSLFPSLVLSLMFLSLLTLGTPITVLANEPHVCINGAISTSWQNLQGNTITYAATCGTHTSNTYLIMLQVYDYYTGTMFCSDTNGGSGNPVPPDPHSVTCPNLPSGTSIRLKAVITYMVTGSDWMAHTDYLRNY